MNLFDITIHSLRRQKGKKVLLVAAMALSLCASLALFSFVNTQRVALESQFDEYGANIVITPQTDDLSLTYGGVSLSGIVTNVREIKAEEVSRIFTIPNKQNIRAVSPKLIGAGRVSAAGASWDALIVGVDFAEESKIKGWWELEGRYPEKANEVVVGAKAAAKMDLAPGINLSVQDRALIVVGVLLETGSQDDSAILAPMAFVEELLDKPGRVSLVEVSALCSDCPIDDLVAQISSVLPDADVQAVRQVMEQRMQVVQQFARFAVSMFAVLAAMCGLFIFATITGAVTERKREIGVMRAIGFSGLHIVRVVVSEALLLGIIAGAVGSVLSVPVLRLVIPAFLSSGGVALDPWLGVLSVIVLIAVALVAAIGPAVRASRFDPAQAIGSL